MKAIYFTFMSFILLIPFSSFAGGSGGGGVLNSLSPEAKSEFSFDGNGGGGGGGVLASKVQPSDYVRMQTLTNEHILKFQYKPAESNAIQSYSVPVENISQQYLDALEKSASTKNWESIEIR
jgi:hypothetical protein